MYSLLPGLVYSLECEEFQCKNLHACVWHNWGGAYDRLSEF